MKTCFFSQREALVNRVGELLWSVSLPYRAKSGVDMVQRYDRSIEGSSRVSEASYRAQAAFRSEAAEVLTSPSSRIAFKEMTGANVASSVSQGDAAAVAKSGGSITEAKAQLISADKHAVDHLDGDGAKAVINMSPTQEGVESLAAKDSRSLIDMAQKDASVLAVVEHNDNLSDSFHEQLKIARYGVA